MNEKFYNLPVEKQKRIINAAYKVFSQNNYKKAPMSEIADEGGISKALLFHYFTNKKELYLFLWKNAIKMTSDVSKEYQVVDTDDFFEMLKRSLFAKCSLMKNYHHIYAFCLNAYYEQYLLFNLVCHNAIRTVLAQHIPINGINYFCVHCFPINICAKNRYIYFFKHYTFAHLTF